VIQIKFGRHVFPILKRVLQGGRPMSPFVILLPVFIYAAAVALLLAYILGLKWLQTRRPVRAVLPKGPAAHMRAGPH
jgi:hypothetical protein